MCWNRAATLPLSQKDYDDLAAKESTKLLADVDKDQKENSAHHHSANVVKAGTGEVVATAGGSQTLSVMRFLNDTIVIHAGETAEWTNEDAITPHTTTFGTAGRRRSFARDDCFGVRQCAFRVHRSCAAGSHWTG